MQAPGSTNDHDLGLFEIGAGAGPLGRRAATVGLYHLAWEVDTLAELERHRRGAARSAASLVGATDHGTTKALYAQDPDGIEFEVSWLVPADRLDEGDDEARARAARPGPARSCPLRRRHPRWRRGVSTPPDRSGGDASVVARYHPPPSGEVPESG